MLAGTDAQDVTVVLLEVIGDLHRAEHDGDPEVTETEDEDRVQRVVEAVVAGEEVGPVAEEGERREVGAQRVEQHGREAHDGAGEDDRHDARVVDLEREVVGLRAVHLTSDHALRVLDRDLADGLVDGDHGGGDGDEEEDHARGLLPTMGIGGGGADLAAERHVDEGGERAGDVGEDADGDQDGRAVADAALGDLLAEPEHDDRAGGEQADAETDEEGLALHDDDGAGEITESEGLADLLRIAEGAEEQRGLDDRDEDGEVAGVLGDLLAADFAFLLQAGDGRHDGRHQLHDDRGADVRHDAQREDRSLEERAAREHVVHRDHSAGRLVGHGVVVIHDVLRIDTRQRDVRADTGDEQQRDGGDQAGPELRDPPAVGEGREHRGQGEPRLTRRKPSS